MFSKIHTLSATKSVSIIQTRASNNIGTVVPKINKRFTNYDAFYKAYILHWIIRHIKEILRISQSYINKETLEVLVERNRSGLHQFT